MNRGLSTDKEYKEWLADIKEKVRKTQIKAAVKVNTELLNFYWELGTDIVLKQMHTKWGDSFLLQLSKDLTAEFPGMKGFSLSNLKYIKQWYLFYSKEIAFGQQLVGKLPADQIVQQVVGQITKIPWGHNIAIISKCKNIEEALYYVQNTIIHNWSRSVLVHQMEKGLYKREGKSVNNFALTLPKAHSDLAVQTLKDPYIFDFLSMTKDYNERELENAFVTHVTQFLISLNPGELITGRSYKNGRKVGCPR